MNNKKGFTLIEALLSIALIGVLAGLSVPIFQVVDYRNSMDVTAISVAQSFRRAQTLSRAVDGDESWGVYAGSDNITIFKGVSYASRDTDFDEDLDLPGSVSVSGVDEIVFDKLTGDPQSTGTLTLTSVNNETRDITINEKGMVQY